MASTVFINFTQQPVPLVSRSGNWVANERIERYAKVVEGAGISPERLRWKEISAAEGLIFANTMKEMSQQLEDIGIEKIKEENEKARKRIEAPLKRKGLIPEE
jgi:predicted TIM-barrel enzyme